MFCQIFRAVESPRLNLIHYAPSSMASLRCELRGQDRDTPHVPTSITDLDQRNKADREDFDVR
jgi:hypothetical protein